MGFLKILLLTLALEQIVNVQSQNPLALLRSPFALACNSIYQEMPQEIQYTMNTNSGNNPQSLGSRLGCTLNASQNMTYILATVNLGEKNMYIGSCLPPGCSNNSALEIISKIAKQNSFLSQLGDIPITMTNPNDYSQKLSTGAILVVIIISTLILFGLFGSYISIIPPLLNSLKQQYPQEDIYHGIKSKDQAQQESKNLSQNNEEKQQKQNNEKQKKEKKNSKIENFFLCFSFYDNFNKIIQVREGDGASFNCINGLRFLMTCWVIWGHEYTIRMAAMSNLDPKREYIEGNKTKVVTIAQSGLFAVDIFFWLSGFLATISILNQFQNLMNKNKFRLIIVPFAFLHRFIRIWPCYMLAFFFYWKLTPYLGSGPIWQNYSDNIEIRRCDDGYYYTMTFTDNLMPKEKFGCFGWGWYLSNDYQFFLITPFLLLLYIKNQLLGWIATTLLLIASIIISMVIAVDKDYPINPVMMDSNDQYFLPYYYIKPYIRIGPYLMGIMFGYIYRDFKLGKPYAVKISYLANNNQVFKMSMWVGGLILTSSMMYVYYPIQQDEKNYSRRTQEFFLVFQKIFFVIGNNMLLLPALFGNQDVFHHFFGMQFWNPLARISFSMYLIHYPIIQIQLYSQEQLEYLSNLQLIIHGISDIIKIAIAGLVFSLIIESPILNLEKRYLHPQPQQIKQEDQIEKRYLNPQPQQIKQEDQILQVDKITNQLL